MRAETKSGVPGIHKHKSGKWVVRCFANGERIYIGVFTDLDQAKAALAEARKKYRGDAE